MQQTGGHWPGVETSGEDFFWRPGPGLGCSAEDVCMYVLRSVNKTKWVNDYSMNITGCDTASWIQV